MNSQVGWPILVDHYTELKAWQQRPLEALYPFVWLDAIHYKIKHDGHYINKAIYTVLGLTTRWA